MDIALIKCLDLHYQLVTPLQIWNIHIALEIQFVLFIFYDGLRTEDIKIAYDYEGIYLFHLFRQRYSFTGYLYNYKIMNLFLISTEFLIY